MSPNFLPLYRREPSPRLFSHPRRGQAHASLKAAGGGQVHAFPPAREGATLTPPLLPQEEAEPTLPSPLKKGSSQRLSPLSRGAKQTPPYTLQERVKPTPRVPLQGGAKPMARPLYYLQEGVKPTPHVSLQEGVKPTQRVSLQEGVKPVAPLQLQ